MLVFAGAVSHVQAVQIPCRSNILILPKAGRAVPREPDPVTEGAWRWHTERGSMMQAWQPKNVQAGMNCRSSVVLRQVSGEACTMKREAANNMQTIVMVVSCLPQRQQGKIRGESNSEDGSASCAAAAAVRARCQELPAQEQTHIQNHIVQAMERMSMACLCGNPEMRVERQQQRRRCFVVSGQNGFVIARVQEPVGMLAKAHMRGERR